MPATFEWEAFARLAGALEALSEFDAFPLMEQWESIVTEGNRRGVLSGRDGFDQPMPALQYRGGAGRRTANRRVPDYGTTLHAATDPAAAAGDNLTSAQYRALTGPRLAPRREASRAVKNLHTQVLSDGSGRWEVVGAWSDVVSRKGVPFLPFHFAGAGRLPRYDLRPVRPQDLQFCSVALAAFVKDHYLSRF